MKSLSLATALGVIFLSALFGCSESSPPRAQLPSSESTSAPDPAAELNKQIEQFNGARPADKGITPIHQRVSRVEYVAEQDVVRCFDQNGIAFLTLERQEDGRFMGVLQVEYHELPGPGEYSWGHVRAEFFLPEATFR
jgi:hypothetical protein